MPSPQHVNEIHIRATPARVWEAMTDPAWTVRYFDGAAIEGSLEPGAAIRYVRPGDDPVGEGVVEVVEPGRRLVITWTVLRDAATVDEPPSRIEWSLEPANATGTVTRLRVRHYDLGLSPKTWAWSGPRWVVALDGLKTVLETGSDLGPVDLDTPTTTDDELEIERSWHRSLAIEANNATWELLDGRELTPDEAFDALGRAYGAAHHWRAATDPGSVNRARAAWLCARVHTAIGDGGAALRMAERCRELTGEAREATDFDRVYAVEAMARALACLGRLEEAAPLRRVAIEAANEVADPADREILDADIAAPPWFGLAPLARSSPPPVD
jgi:uncharacterized protein YndB with AHSA1/START domain